MRNIYSDLMNAIILYLGNLKSQYQKVCTIFPSKDKFNLHLYIQTTASQISSLILRGFFFLPFACVCYIYLLSVIQFLKHHRN